MYFIYYFKIIFNNRFIKIKIIEFRQVFKFINYVSRFLFNCYNLLCFFDNIVVFLIRSIFLYDGFCICLNFESFVSKEGLNLDNGGEIGKDQNVFFKRNYRVIEYLY